MPANHFNTDNDCLDYLEHLRWGDSRKPICPWTGSSDCRQITDDDQGRKRYYSKIERKSFNAGTNTIFHNAQIDLPIWFDGIDQFLIHKKGLSSIDLHRFIGVTQSTAHKMETKMRAVFGHPGLIARLGFINQIDETYYGQLLKNMHEYKKQALREAAKITGDRTLLNKTPVFGIIDECGNVFSTVVKDTTADTLIPIITKHAKPGSIIVSDEFAGYRKLPEKGYIHLKVNHSQGQYVVENRNGSKINISDLQQHLNNLKIQSDGDQGDTLRHSHNKKTERYTEADIRKNLHNNKIERYWHTQKQAYHGTYHHAKNLELFCKEMDFRKNYDHLKPDELKALFLKHSEWNDHHVPLLQQKNNKPNIVREYLNSFKQSTEAEKNSISLHR